MRTLFAIAREKAPSIIFIDEIDSILSKRTNEDHEASRRLKTEFLVQFDGAGSGEDDAHVIVIGATNIPESLDDAVIRRLTKRIFVGSPDAETRKTLISKLLPKKEHKLSEHDIDKLVNLTDGYSSSDLTALCRDASMGPIRTVNADKLVKLDVSQLEPISLRHFETLLQNIRPSVSKQRLKQYEQWNNSLH